MKELVFNKCYLPLCGVILLGAIFRFYGLDAHSLWLDDLRLYDYIKNSDDLFTLISFLYHNETHPPAYYSLIYVLFKFSTDAELILRIPAAFFGTVSILQIYLLGNELYNRRVAFVAAMLLAFNPLIVYYSQEGMMYSFLLCVSLICLRYWFKIDSSHKNRIVYIIVAILTFYTHYYGALLVFCQALIGLLRYRNQLIRYACLHLIIGLFCSIWIPSMFHHYDVEKWWMPRPSFYYFNAITTEFFFHSFIKTIVLTLGAFVMVKSLLTFNRKKMEVSLLITMSLFLALIISVFKSIWFASSINLKYYHSFFPHILIITSVILASVFKKRSHFFIMNLFLGVIYVGSVYYQNKYCTQRSMHRELSLELVKMKEKYPGAKVITRGLYPYYLHKYSPGFSYRFNALDGHDYNIDYFKEKLFIKYSHIIYAYILKEPSRSFLREISQDYNLLYQKMMWSYTNPAAIMIWKRNENCLLPLPR